MDGSDIAVLIAVNLPVYVVLGRLFFGSWGDFLRVLRFWFTPNIISWFRGEYWEDRAAELLFGVYLLCCAVVVFGEYRLITTYLLQSE